MALASPQPTSGCHSSSQSTHGSSVTAITSSIVVATDGSDQGLEHLGDVSKHNVEVYAEKEVNTACAHVSVGMCACVCVSVCVICPLVIISPFKR